MIIIIVLFITSITITIIIIIPIIIIIITILINIIININIIISILTHYPFTPPTLFGASCRILFGCSIFCFLGVVPLQRAWKYFVFFWSVQGFVNSWVVSDFNRFDWDIY
jgi:hypothetical protein